MGSATTYSRANRLSLAVSTFSTAFHTFVGMLRADFFEGLCVGHAPKKCRICGKWFLTTNARHTKYCGGFAPGDKLGRTCRQIGNLRGREQRELAPDHPIKKIYNRRMNTIDKKLDRGTLDQDAAGGSKSGDETIRG